MYSTMSRPCGFICTGYFASPDFRYDICTYFRVFIFNYEAAFVVIKWSGLHSCSAYPALNCRWCVGVDEAERGIRDAK